MRIELTCELDENIIPVDYNKAFISYFKNSIENYNQELKEFFYDNPLRKEFSFALILPIEKIEKGLISLRDKNFRLIISFYSLTEALHFYNAFHYSRKKKYTLGPKNFFKVLNIKKVKEKEIKNNIVIFRALSPIVIREKLEDNKEWYHVLNEQKGIETLKTNMSYTLSQKFSKEQIDKIEIIALDIKKVITTYQGLKFAVSRGTFAVKGDNEILEYFYKAGFGSKCGSGYGLVDIIE